MKNKAYNRYLLFLTFFAAVFCILTIGGVGAAEVPSANFTSNITSGNAPLDVQFNDTSIGNATSWSWGFGDSQTSTEQNPAHSYTTEGKYSVSLTASNEAGSNTIIQNDYINVAIPPTVSTSLTGGTYNETQTVTLTSDDPTATIYYANDKTDPRISSTRIEYTGSITISNTTTLRYAAVDVYGNWSQLYLQNYVIGNGTASKGPSNNTGPETNTTYWTYPTGGTISYATPVIGTDGIIYIGSGDGKLYALNPDGTIKWTYTTGGAIYGSATIGTDGTIYVGSRDKNLYALNSDGTLKWFYATGNYIYGSAVIGSDGTIYVGSYDKNLYALNSDGSLKWSYTTGGYIYNYGGSPTIGADGTIYVGSYDKNLYALNSDGTLKWFYVTGNYIYGSPTIGADGTIYIGSRDNKLYAINPDGTLKWTYTTGGYIYGSPTIGADGTIYVGSNDGKLYVLNSDGTLKWTYTAGSAIQGSVLIGTNKTIYFGSGQDVYALKDVAPEADFTSTYVSSDDLPITIHFTDKSLHDPTSWLWDFGDGTTSTEQNPTHNYGTEGNYTVILTAINANGTNNFTKTIQVHLFSISNSLASGTYTATQSATLTSNDSTATIYYTTDSTDPRTSSTRTEYTEPINISNTTTLRYAALDIYVNWSPMYLQNYVIGTGTASRDPSNYTGPETNTTNWTYTTGGNINYATPATGSDGTIYIGMSDGKFYALNPDGTIKWTYTTGGAIYGSATIGTDGTIYIGSGDGKLYALNPDGTLKWSYTTGGAIDGAPVFNSADCTIYVGSEDKNLYAINCDGTLKWSYTTNSAIYCYYGGPVIGSDGTIYVGSWSQRLYAINPDGSLKWYYTTGHKLFGSPTISADGTIYIGCRDNKLYAINPDGTLKWTYALGNARLATTTIGNDGILYVGSEDGILYALNLDGTLKWSYTIGGTLRGAPAIDADGTIYIGSADGKLCAINSDGTLKWIYTAGSGPVLIGTDGTIYFASGTKVYALKDVLPVADFTSTQLTNGETPITIQFTDKSIHDTSSWLWNFGDGTTSTEQNPTHNYTTAGNYTISLTVTNDVGSDIKTVTKMISVYPPVEVNFTSDVASGTSPLTVNFTDSSLYATSWAWDFDGDGNIDSTEQNPTYTYNNTPGKYNVTLTATGPGGSDTKTETIIILPSVTASVKGGSYNATQTVTLTSNDPTSTIYYTTDGTDPTTSGTRIPYTGPIAIVNTSTLRYAAMSSEEDWSPLYIQNYIIGTSTGSGLADTDWPKSGGDLSNTGQSEYTGPETNTTLWTYNTGSSIDNLGTPVVGSDGTIYIGADNGKLYALNLDGSLKWTYTTGAYIYSATIGSDGTIYAGSWDNTFYAINPDGSLKWNYTTEGNIIGGSSVADDGTIYFGSCDGNLYALNPDGSLKWKYNTGEIIETVGGGPAIGADGTIYLGNLDGIVYALNPDGSLKWSYITKKGQYNIYGISIGTDGTIYAVTYGVGYDSLGYNYSKIYALNVDGTLKWTYTFNTGGMFGPPSVGADGTIYIGNADGKFYALNPDGTLKWSYNTGNVRSSTIGADGTIYVGSEDGNLYALNPDGTVKWTYTTGGKVYGSVAIGSDGTLYFGSADGYVYALADTVLQADQTVGTIPLTVHFTSSAISPASWYWDFGDGTTSREQNPIHTYANPGNYTVTLIVTDTNGNNSTRSFIDYIKVSDVTANANYTATTAWGTIPDAIPVTYNEIQFTDNSTGTNLSWLWDFGDGTTSMEQNPKHTYTIAGNYLVSLTVTNSAGSSTYETIIQVMDNPLLVNSSLAGGSYNKTQTVTLTTNDPTATIYYTIDNTDPTTSSTRIQYTGPVNINATTTLKFVAVDDVGTVSQVQSETYVIDTEAPIVSVIDPVEGAVVKADKVIQVIFNEAVKSGSMWIDLKNSSGTLIPATTSIDGNVLTITPKSVLGSGEYSLCLHTGCVADLVGNNLAVCSSSFVVDNVAPTVVTVDPASNKVVSGVNRAIVITFSEVIKAGSAFGSIKVTNADGVSVSPLYKVINGKTLTLTRIGNYINGLTYTVTLPTGSIIDQAGNALSTFTSKFIVDNAKPTVTSVDPVNNKVVSGVNRAIVITFSEAIKAGSAFSSIKVTNPDGVLVKPLYKVINGKTLTLTRIGNYINGLTYTITLPTGSITDTVGNALTTFTSKFTVDNAKPTVTSVNPVNNKVVSGVNRAIVITFSENIKAGSAFSSIKVINPDGVAVKPLYKVINGKTLTLTRNGNYINGLTYTITLPTGSITDTAGNALSTFTSKFKVDNTKPTVTSVNPANNKVINMANRAIVITFSENIKAGSAFSSIKVTNPDGVSVKPLYKVINGKTLTLTRNGNYINGLTYTITLPIGSITDAAGNAITTYTSKFTTRRT